MEITITLDETTYEYVSREAEEQRLAIEKMLSEKIRETYVPWYINSDDPMDKEIAAYAVMHSNLVESHLNQFVAITGGNLVDFDDDPGELERRLHEKYPNEIVHVTRVRPYIKMEIVVRSPRFIRDTK